MRHRLATVLLVLSFLLVFVGMGWAYMVLRDISQPLIIHFTEKTGITEVGTLGYILMNGGFWVLFLLVNSAIAAALLDRKHYLGMFLVGSTFFFAILIFIWFAAIIHVN
ncbi:MAG: hypothetical protein FJY98_03685 [Candidatus Liptonbacteria bacterium]|nr:hypothetical protein [Candidatus Liptonbacteria bacterium]